MSFFFSIRPTPRATRTDTLFPHTTLFRSVKGGVELACATDRPLCPADACRVDHGAQGGQLDGLVHRVLVLLVVGYIDADEDPADLLGQRLALLGVQVGDDDLGALGRQLAGGGGTDSGGAAGDDCTCSCDVHDTDANWTQLNLAAPSGKRPDRKSTRLNSSHYCASRMPYTA